jgi:hypothetical protein
MLVQYAITPGVFSEAESSGRSAVYCLNDLCRGEGMFPDLRAGQWGRSVEAIGPLGKRFLTFARKNHRLFHTASKLPDDPEGDEQWLWEALAFHEKSPCYAIITGNSLSSSHKDDPIITSIESINQTSWWELRSSSKRICRSIPSYLDALKLILSACQFPHVHRSPHRSQGLTLCRFHKDTFGCRCKPSLSEN